MAHAIDVEGVTKVFDTGAGEPILAVAGVDLQVREREFVTLVGRSGCGKSTLLRMIAGLTAPSAGEVRIGGTAVGAPRPDVSLMFQRSALLPWRSVLENVLLPIDVMGLDRRRHVEVARELLSLVGLDGFEDRRPYELSGGMQQRAAMCRALVHDPEVLLMDEPFGALDALTREELSVELQRIWTERRKTIVFVTHSIDEAVVLADRIVVMTPRPGRIATIVDVDLPRPRSLGPSEHSEAMKHYADRVREVLFAPAGAERAA
jgi:NitT/TauT family transport system ATP-binding protein